MRASISTCLPCADVHTYTCTYTSLGVDATLSVCVCVFVCVGAGVPRVTYQTNHRTQKL